MDSSVKGSDASDGLGDKGEPVGTPGTGTLNRKGEYWEPDSKRFQEHLPNSSDQSARWWYSAFHNTTAIVGAGVLGLPFAMKYLMWPGGVVVMLISWCTSLYTLWQLCAMHEVDGHRFCRYHELGQYIFGPRLGIWIVLPCQLTMMIGLAIVYSVTGGTSAKLIYDLYYTGSVRIGISLWILFFGICQIFLSLLPNFNSISFISLSAAVMSLGYSTIAIGLLLKNGKQPGTVYNTDSLTQADKILSGFNSLGIIAFAYGGHNVILEIQATLPSPPATLKPYMRGVYIAYGIVSWCYFGVAFCGYWAYGINANGNILTNLGHPRGVIALASAMVVVHVFGSFQVYTVPVYDMIEHAMLRRKIQVTFIKRTIYRTIYVLIITFIAILLPFFSDLLGFVGALATGPTTFWLPPLMFVMFRRLSIFSVHGAASYFCIVWGVTVTILGAIGGLRSIIISASKYKTFQ